MSLALGIAAVWLTASVLLAAVLARAAHHRHQRHHTKEEPMADSQQTRPTTPEEDIKELYSRTAKLNDIASALLAPAWGSATGIIPADHPLYVAEKPPAAQQEQAAPVNWQAITRRRERELKTVGEARHRAEQQAAELRARLEDAEAGITAAIRQRKAAEDRAEAASRLGTRYMADAERFEAERDGAYRERAHLLAWLATLHQDHAVLAPAIDIDDEDGWWLFFLTIAGRQLSWHIAPRDVPLFDHVQRVDVADPRAQWDGHTTDEKYQRIAELSRR